MLVRSVPDCKKSLTRIRKCASIEKEWLMVAYSADVDVEVKTDGKFSFRCILVNRRELMLDTNTGRASSSIASSSVGPTVTIEQSM